MEHHLIECTQEESNGCMGIAVHVQYSKQKMQVFTAHHDSTLFVSGVGTLGLTFTELKVQSRQKEIIYGIIPFEFWRFRLLPHCFSTEVLQSILSPQLLCLPR